MNVTLRIDALTGIASLQDSGRVGHEHLGIPAGGFWHTPRAHLANALAGNSHDCAAIELLAGSCTLTNIASDGTVLAVSGPAICSLTNPRNGDAVMHPTHHATYLPSGYSATITHNGTGPVYVAAHGLTGTSVLGSVGACTFTGITPNPLQVGVELRAAGHQAVSAFTPVAVTRADTQPPAILPYTPHVDAAPTLRVQVIRAGRMGAHLRTGSPHEDVYAAARDLPSHPVHPGLLQVTPAGILALGVDAGTTGGYPTLGVIHSRSVSKMSLLFPGADITLIPDHGVHANEPPTHLITSLG